jgi:hypothetical protein
MIDYPEPTTITRAGVEYIAVICPHCHTKVSPPESLPAHQLREKLRGALYSHYVEFLHKRLDRVKL